MFQRLFSLMKDKERRARLLFWVWILSLLMVVLGYIIIFSLLF